MTLVLGAALGPRATHVEVRDADSGALAASGRARHTDLGPDADDPTVWWRSLVSAVAQAGEREVAAISVSGGHPGLVLLDGAGAVLPPEVPWAEASLDGDAARLRRALGAERWAKRAGVLPGITTAVTRLAWLRRTQPATFARIGAVLLPHDWLTYRLAGRVVTDRGGASLTGAWSAREDRWIPEVLGAVAPEARPESWLARLPTVLGAHERADWLTAPVYELLGLRGRPIVGPGTGEPMAVALGLGLTPGRFGLSLGTATMVLAPIEAPITDPSGSVRSRADATGGHLAVSTAPGGAALVETVAELLGVPVAELSALALHSEPAATVPVLVPGVPGRAGAVLTGLRPGVGRAQLARAAFEGVSCAALDAADAVREAAAAPAPTEPLCLAGPADGLDAHAQAMATLSGHPVLAAAGGSPAATGACIQAAAVLREEDPATVAAAWQLPTGRTFEPQEDPGRVDRRVAHTEERGRQRRALLSS